MKNLTFPNSIKQTIFTIAFAAIGLFSLSFKNADNDNDGIQNGEANYQVVNQKAFIAGAGKLKDWKAEISNFDCGGTFVGRAGELGSISDFSFSLPIEQLSNAKDGSTLEQAISNVGGKQIVFMQKQLMILPIMKMVYVGGDVTIKDGSHASPIYLSYELDEDQNIKVTGKQHVRLSEFGIKSPEINAGAFEDEIVINIEFTLVRPQFVQNQAKKAEPVQLAAVKLDSKRADTRD